MIGILMVVQALTNLAGAPPGEGLPDGWRLHKVRGVPPATFEVREGGRLQVTSDGGAGFALFQLAEPLQPGRGLLAWEWRTRMPVLDADLRESTRDDAPIRVLVMFEDRKTLFYSWGNNERYGDSFPSWTSDDRQVLVLRNARDADGSWHAERRDPFADYARAFGRDPDSIVAVGVSADTDTLGGSSVAEVRGFAWARL